MDELSRRVTSLMAMGHKSHVSSHIKPCMHSMVLIRRREKIHLRALDVGFFVRFN